MLQSKNITLRALEPADIDLLYSWENNTSVWMVSNTLVPYSKHLLTEYLLTAHQDIFTNKQLRLVIELTQEKRAIGLIDLFDFDPQHQRAGIAILIAEQPDRRKGYAAEALDTLVDYCFSHLHLHQVHCTITHDNEASMRLFEANKFEKIGVRKAWIKNNGQWFDEFMYQRINE